MEEIIEKLSLERRKQGISQEHLATVLGITLGGVCHYELGRRKPSFQTLKIWADYLGYDFKIELIEK